MRTILEGIPRFRFFGMPLIRSVLASDKLYLVTRSGALAWVLSEGSPPSRIS